MTCSAGVLKHKVTLTFCLRLLFSSISIFDVFPFLTPTCTLLRSPVWHGFVWSPDIGVLHFHLTHVRGTANMATGVWLCQTSVQRIPPHSFTGSADMATDLCECQTSVPRISASCSIFYFGVSPMWRRAGVVTKHWCHVFPPHHVLYRGRANAAW